MKFLQVVLLLCFFSPAYSQDEVAARKYYEIGLKKASDFSVMKEGRSPFGEAFPYFFRATELAKEGSDLQLKAIYKIAYLYNFASDELKPIVIKKTIKGLQYLRKLTRKDSLTGEFYFRAGLAFTRDYRPDSAIYVFKDARNIFQTLNYPLKVSDCYHAIGDVYKDNLYDYNSAESFYEKALAVNERAGSSELNLFMISKLHYELSLVNKFQHDYEKALAYSLKNIAYAETLPKKFKVGHTVLSSAYTSAADIYSEMGFYTKAIELYKKVISLSRKINEPNLNLGDHYFGLASVYRKESNVNQSVFNYSEALKIYEMNPNLKNVLHIKTCQRLGELYLELKDFKNSRFYFSRGIKLLNEFELKKSGQASELYRSIGKYFGQLQQIDSALIYYQRSLIAASSNFNSLKLEDNPKSLDIVLNDFAYETLLAKAITLSGLYKENQDGRLANSALASFGLAEQLLIDSRARLDMDNSKWVFFDSNFGLYQQVLSLLYEMEQKQHSDTLLSKAFYYMESSKSKMLADAFNEAEFSRPLLTSDSLIQFLDMQRRNLYKLQDELKRSEGDSYKQNTIRNSIIDVDRKMQRAENDVARKYPSYIKTKYRYEIPSLVKVEEFSKKNDVSIVEYFWGANEVFGLSICNGKSFFLRLGDTDLIQPVLKSVHDMLDSDKYSYSQEAVSLFEKNAHLSYNLLISPFEPMITNKKRLIILPDGPIEQIPFEVLATSYNRKSTPKNFATINYLLKKYVISYAFSSSYLLNKTGRSLSKPQMLAFGLTDGERLRSGLNPSVKDSNLLPGSELELKSILEEFPNGEYHFGKTVTEEEFKKKAPDFDLIHLAVHGIGDTEQNYSASLFFSDTIASKEDGRLHWYELFGLPLKAKLAVISSCESGIGKSYRGEGMLSMASAFAFSGCKNIVMGLWKVDDRVSSDLMKGFYRNLQNGNEVDVALAQAKRDYLERSDDLTSNPRLWASLVSYGNEQVIRKDQVAIWYFAGILISVLLLIYLYKRKRAI